jgi:diamine N-acetyltransferase
MPTLSIRRAGLSDLKELQSIGRKTFYESFSQLNTAEDMQDYLNNSFSEARLSAELTNGDSEFYFALYDNNVVGYLKINFRSAQTEPKDLDPLEIERIYVSREFQGKEIGKALFDHAVQRARDENCSYIWLGVWERNEKAIRFYERQGFIEFDRHIFVLGSDKQTDLLMKRPVDIP